MPVIGSSDGDTSTRDYKKSLPQISRLALMPASITISALFLHGLQMANASSKEVAKL